MTVTCDCSSDCTVKYGTCHCGCGEKTSLASQTNLDRGWKKGEPLKWRKGHSTPSRKGVHYITEIDPETKIATCAVCGPDIVVFRSKNATKGWRCTGPRAIINPGVRRNDHILSDLDIESRTAVCTQCGPTQIRIKGNYWSCITKIREYSARERSRIKEDPVKDSAEQAYLGCNRGVGAFGDDASRLRAAADYLDAHR